jgi:hypothetical protein
LQARQGREVEEMTQILKKDIATEKHVLKSKQVFFGSQATAAQLFMIFQFFASGGTLTTMTPEMFLLIYGAGCSAASVIFRFFDKNKRLYVRKKD